MRNDLTQERLKELLHYDPETGVFTWRVRRGGIKPGSAAGSVSPQGYVRINIGGHLYLRHRLAWLYSRGSWPDQDIDHINGVYGDDRVGNLRQCSKSENGQNRPARQPSVSGLIGVSWKISHKKWRARITLNLKSKTLGYYNSKEEAHAAYLSAKSQLHTFQPTPRNA